MGSRKNRRLVTDGSLVLLAVKTSTATLRPVRSGLVFSACILAVTAANADEGGVALHVEGAVGLIVERVEDADGKTPWETICQAPCNTVAPHGWYRVRRGRDVSKPVVVEDFLDKITLHAKEHYDHSGYIVAVGGFLALGAGWAMVGFGVDSALGCWSGCNPGATPTVLVTAGLISVAVGIGLLVGGFVHQHHLNARGPLELVSALPLRVAF
jgi:hypothetical protein